jgi:hypothetical protein
MKVARASKIQSIDVSNFLLGETLVSLHEKKMQYKWEVTVLFFKIAEAEKSNIYNEYIGERGILYFFM